MVGFCKGRIGLLRASVKLNVMTAAKTGVALCGILVQQWKIPQLMSEGLSARPILTPPGQCPERKSG